MYLFFWMVFENVSSEVLPESSTINEYRSSRFSAGFYLLLPLAGLSIAILGKRYLFEKILLQLDSKYLTVICPCFIKRENIVKWACTRLPPFWSSHSTKTLSGGLKDLWKDGSLLCTLINTAIPGACPNPHIHWKQSPIHAQNLAYKYFGISQIFSKEDLKRNLSLSLERKFILFLNEMQQAINRKSENVTNDSKITARYILRGMGLFSGEQHKKASFYIYLDENHEEEENEKDNNIIVQIRGPFGTYGEAVTPKLVNKKRKRNIKRKQERRPSIQFIENLQSNINNLSWNFGRIQKRSVSEDISIETILENDRIKVTYIPTNYGMFEINLMSGGELLKGCPYNVHIFLNENTKNIDTLPPRNTRKAVKKNLSLPDLPEAAFVKVNSSNTLKPPSFNFKEVVDEITKNGKVFKEILGHTPENETTTLEISNNPPDFNQHNEILLSTIKEKLNLISNTENHETAIETTSIFMKSDFKNEINKTDKPDKNLEMKKISNSLEKTTIIVSNTECKEVLVDQQIITDDNDNMGKHNLDVSDNTKINNATKAVAIFANKNLINDGKKPQLENKETSFVFEPKYSDTVNINKIKIPEMFANKPTNNISSKLDDKYFKNIYNESNKVGNKYIKLDTNSDDSAIEINNNFVEYGNYNSDLLESKIRDTSSICTEHIVPEVEYSPLTVAEKRKIFAQQSISSNFTSQNSSFSDYENGIDDRKYRNESAVLNISNNLKESNTNSLNEQWSLCSTVSLPNLSLESDFSYSFSIKDKKEFWENLSSRSSSSISGRSLSPKKLNNTLSELERSRLIWKRPENIEVNNKENLYKSADDILVVSSKKQSVEFNSIDNSLDLCGVLSVADRKRLLLQGMDSKDIVRRKTVSGDSYVANKNVLNENKKNYYITSISDKVKKYKSALELSPKNPLSVLKIKKPNIKPNTDVEQNQDPSKNRTKIRTQFNKAIKYFKNLEKESQPKINDTNKRNIEINIIPLSPHRGGSLKLSSISEKFSVNNLYDDVFGNRRGSFKGTPNKSALVEALATFSRNQNYMNDNSDNEDSIQYEFFKMSGRRRRRKSLKSLFDIHY